MIDNNNQSFLFGLGSPRTDMMFADPQTPGSTTSQQVLSEGPMGRMKPGGSSDSTLNDIESTKNQMLASKAGSILYDQIKLDPVVAAQFPEIAQCVQAYLEYYIADGKISLISGILKGVEDGIQLRIKALSTLLKVTNKEKANKEAILKDLNWIYSDIKKLMYGPGKDYDSWYFPNEVVIDIAKYKPLSHFTGKPSSDKLWKSPELPNPYDSASKQKLSALATAYDRIFKTGVPNVQTHAVDTVDAWYEPDLSETQPVPPFLDPLLRPNGGQPFVYNGATKSGAAGYLPAFGSAQQIRIQDIYKSNPSKYGYKDSVGSGGPYAKSANGSLDLMTTAAGKTEGIVLSLVSRAYYLNLFLNDYTEDIRSDYNKYFMKSVGITIPRVEGIFGVRVKDGELKCCFTSKGYVPGLGIQKISLKKFVTEAVKIQQKNNPNPDNIKGYYFKIQTDLAVANQQFSKAFGYVKTHCGGLPPEVQSYASMVAEVEAHAYSAKKQSEIASDLAVVKKAAAKLACQKAEKLNKLTEEKLELDKEKGDLEKALEDALASGDPQAISAAQGALNDLIKKRGSVIKERMYLKDEVYEASRATTRTGYQRGEARTASEESTKKSLANRGNEIKIPILDKDGKPGVKKVVVTPSKKAEKDVKDAEKTNRETEKSGQDSAKMANDAVKLTYANLELTGAGSLTPGTQEVAETIIIPELTVQEDDDDDDKKGFPWMLLLAAGAAAAGAPVVVPIGLAAAGLMAGKKDDK
jgi:hypothetical protein